MAARKLLTSVILILVCAVSTAQTGLESFFGLKIGEKYNEVALLNAMIASGMDRQAVVARDTLANTGLLAYTFDGILLNRQDSDEPVKTVVSLIVSSDYRFEGVIITPQTEGAASLTFISDDAKPELMHYANANLKTVEGTFFGITLGDSTSLASIVKAVGDKGTYMRSGNEGRARVHTFKDLVLDDYQWDYALFSVTPDGKLVGFTVYDVFEGFIKGYHPANRLHINMRNLYFKKYGIPFVESDDEEEISNEYVFSGQNGFDQVLSFFETTTERGKDAYCVQMEFIHDSLNRKL